CAAERGRGGGGRGRRRGPGGRTGARAVPRPVWARQPAWGPSKRAYWGRRTGVTTQAAAVMASIARPASAHVILGPTTSETSPAARLLIGAMPRRPSEWIDNTRARWLGGAAS